jgi:hypothetical protein
MSGVLPNPDNVTDSPARAHEEQPDPGALSMPLPVSISPLIEQAQRAFCQTLPLLLQERPGQWVAYHGDRQLGFATTKTELYQACLRQGLQRGEFLVRCIEPDVGELIFGPGTVE